MCRLIVSEIVTASCMTSRVEIIGKSIMENEMMKIYIITFIFRKMDRCGGYLQVPA